MYLRAVIILASLGLIRSKIIDLSCPQIGKFVDGHNFRRLLLAKGQVKGQPAAAYMNSIVWDEELSDKATKWAANNKFAHNPDKTVASRRFETGENIYLYRTTNTSYQLDPEEALKSWFNEYMQYSYRPLQKSDFNGMGPDVGHYTQMVWSDSTYMGCGISQTLQKDMNTFLVVCNYGPSGNYLEQVPYESGRPSGRLSCAIKDCNLQYGDKC